MQHARVRLDACRSVESTLGRFKPSWSPVDFSTHTFSPGKSYKAFSYISLFLCLCVHFLVHALGSFCHHVLRGPVVCLTGPVDVTGLGFQPVLQLYRVNCDCVKGSQLCGMPMLWWWRRWCCHSYDHSVRSIILLALNSIKARKAALMPSLSSTGPVEMLRNDKGQEVAE